MLTLKSIQNKVEERISDYIEFDINEIFNQSDYITIYGGSIRDSIANKDIHDIDILCMPDSAIKLRKFLKEKYNYQTLDLYDQDTLNMYKGISLISEPWTLMNDNKKIIQIIRPTWQVDGSQTQMSNYYKVAYYNIIKNVDISCCGVFLDIFNNEVRLRESCKDAIVHCLSGTYLTNYWSKLYDRNRTAQREHKLSWRGWFDLHKDDGYLTIKGSREIKKIKRRLKIFTIEFKPEYNYKIWTEDEYYNRMAPTDNGLPF